MYKLWIKRVYIRSPGIACDRNPPVTHADFDDVPLICREYRGQYHHAMHLTHHI